MRTMALTLALILVAAFAVPSFAEELSQSFYQYADEEIVLQGDEAVGQELERGDIQEERAVELENDDSFSSSSSN